jgi:V8-like Glu-specific endopeptidase
LKVRRTLALLTAAAFAVTAFFSASAAAYPVAHPVDKAAAKVTAYWTAKRMRNAIPADRDSRPIPAKPGRGGGGTRGGGGSDGGTSPGKSTEVEGDYPSTFGKVFFTDGGLNYVCSGSAVGTASKSVVWTAGHCVNEGPGDNFTNFMFAPAYRGGATPYGKFAATTLITTSGWRTSGEWGVDVGAAVVGTNADGQTLSGAVAEAPIVFDALRNQSYSIYGYPAAKKFNGQLMRVCKTTWLLDDSATPDTMGAACDMTGGSSGGPWITSSGAVASVTSYGYSNLKNVLFGPHLESEAEFLYNTAIATP